MTESDDPDPVDHTDDDETIGPDDLDRLTAALAGLSPEARRRVASAWARSRRP